MAQKQHGMSRTPEWEAWRSMLKRCYKSNTRNYDRYGGRGITVCDRWRNSFADFLADLGHRPSAAHSLHRKNNDGNYEPSNCEWALPVVQANNRSAPRRNVVKRPRLTAPGSRPVNFKDLTNATFGRWVVVRYHGRAPGRQGGAVWWCRCRCGIERGVRAKYLMIGRSTSCGCYHKELVAELGRTVTKAANTQHGLSTTKEYRAWNQMNQRCHNPRNPTYERYGAKGVTVCEKWRGDFTAFLADMGSCPSSGHSIDRINPNGNYEPGNCRWATDEQQRRNQRRTRKFEYKGETLTLPELRDRTGISLGTLRFRLVQQGWGVERAISTDPKKYHKRDGGEP